MAKLFMSITLRQWCRGEDDLLLNAHASYRNTRLDKTVSFYIYIVPIDGKREREKRNDDIRISLDSDLLTNNFSRFTSCK